MVQLAQRVLRGSPAPLERVRPELPALRAILGLLVTVQQARRVLPVLRASDRPAVLVLLVTEQLARLVQPALLVLLVTGQPERRASPALRAAV